jgi:acetyl esterase/lipase|tara:strand:- start:313 stop:1161 length:849 start_codon:yes stop_codon:yes gene_type:complete
MIIKIFKIIVIFYSLNLLGQEIITLPYDNTGLDYQGPEVKTKGYFTDKHNFQNISIPTIQVFLPKGNLNTKTAMIVCPGGGMRANAIHHEGFDVAKALNKKGVAAFVLKYRLVPIHLIGKNEGLDHPYSKEKKQLAYGHLDALNAIAHVRVNALKYEINPEKIGIMGFSAGGAVTMEATYKSSEKNRPNFIAPIYPWMNIVDNQEPPAYGPPIFIVCTTEDAFKLAIPSAKIYTDWAEKNYISELHLYHHGKHGFGMRKINYPVDNWFDNMVDWIDAIGMLN